MFGLAVAAAILIAAGVLLVLGFLSARKLKEKVKERNNDFFKALITDKEEISGIPVLTVDVYDYDYNRIDRQRYASLDGTNIDIGESYYSIIRYK